MNIIKKHIRLGLKAWKEKGAKVSYLKKGKLSIPFIFLGSSIQSNKLFLICSGFHLEETSGPLLLLDPQICLPLLAKLIKRMNVVIFPVINQFGLSFKETREDKYLRYNREGLNYNSAWGFETKKCQEVALVEKALIEFHKEYQIVFVLSLHEDSTEPGNGYVWMNNIDKKTRQYIQSNLEKKVNKNILKMKLKLGLRRGKVERGYSVIDAKDDSFENFTSDILGIPTLLSEAPFGLDLRSRMAFHKAALSSIPL